MTFLYSVLENIEPVPQKFINLAVDPEYDKKLSRFGYFSSTFSQAYLERSVTVDHKNYITRYQRKYDLGNEFQSWCQKNLHSDCFHAGVAYNQGSDPYHGPHIDKGRKYALYYSLKSGGVNVTTSFWRHPTLPQEPGEQEFPDYACDYSGLEQLASVIFQPNQWYLFNTGVIHSVENVNDGSRISLQASLADNVDISSILGKNSLYCQ
jgi:hypothetical protein